MNSRQASERMSSRCATTNRMACSALRITGRRATRLPARPGWAPLVFHNQGCRGYDPARAALDEIAPAVVVEEIRANGRLLFSNRPEDASGSQFEVGAWEEKTPIRLPPGGARVLTFHYTASAYVAAEKTRFRYRLVGLDDHWIDAGSRRELHFADLRPRSYRLG